jgi:hypothetical protein
MFQEYEVVRLKDNQSSISVPIGSRGTVLIVHQTERPAYEVEFVDEHGVSLGVYTVQDADLMEDDTP